MKDRKLLVFTAPSGSGKTTIVRHLIDTFDNLAFSVSATTRKRRPHERHGRDYYYLSNETFHLWIEEDAFVEWEEVYDNQLYGTAKFEIERLWAMGKHVIFDIDVKGATSIKNQYPDETIVVFIKVPSVELLIERLKRRETETEQSLQKRIQRVQHELRYAHFFDVVLINDTLEETLQNAREMVAKWIGDPYNGDQ